MKLLIQDRRVVIPILCAIILGVLFGNFLGNTLLTEETLGVIGGIETKEIYLLQTGFFYDEVSAQLAYNEMRKEGIETLVVKEYNQYFLYHDVARDPREFNELITYFKERHIEYFIKERSPFRYLEQLEVEKDPSLANTYDFYFSTIEYYLLLLEGRRVNFKNDYLDQLNDANMDVFNHLYLLNSSVNTKLSTKYELLVYKSLVETIF